LQRRPRNSDEQFGQIEIKSFRAFAAIPIAAAG
jgi:hypothetical protein